MELNHEVLDQIIYETLVTFFAKSSLSISFFIVKTIIQSLYSPLFVSTV